MTNKFYSDDGRRALRVNDLFNLVAPRYDLMNDLQSFGLHRWWKRRLVRMARALPSDRAIDLCCGTGDITFALAQAGAQVVGLDFNRPMLAEAEKKMQRLRNTTAPPQFICGNALEIPFPENSFDIVTMGYGLRNLSSFEAGLREMHRVARPGGRLLVLDFGKPDNRLWRAIYFGYLRLFIPLLGRIVCGDAAAYAYILESLNHYPAQRGVAAIMNDLKLKDVRIVNLLGGVMSINYGEKNR